MGNCLPKRFAAQSHIGIARLTFGKSPGDRRRNVRISAQKGFFMFMGDFGFGP